MPIAVLAGLAIVAAIVILGRARRRRAWMIRAPRYGILNLKGAAAENLIAMDVEALSPVLGVPIRGSASSPFCDILFIYCDIADDGKIGNFPGTLRDLIEKCRAPVVVVATENPGDAYTATMKRRAQGRANVVMTLSRRGDAFGNFFHRLFREMKRGVSMPVAWAKLAPQFPSKEHENLPSTIFACEVGQLVLGGGA
jgi:hypothetical protein